MRRLKKTDELKALIKQKCDLVDLMRSSGVKIVKDSGPTARALCFFHKEDTPSLYINRHKGLYNCFGAGCDAGGDAIAFIRQYEKVEFLEAIEILAKKYDVDMGAFYESVTPEERRQQVLVQNAKKVGDYLHSVLGRNDAAVRFLGERGISPTTAKTFAVGFCDKKAYDVGLAKLDKASAAALETFDRPRWIGRISYPVMDASGNVRAFYTRGTGIKYLGTSNSSPLRKPGLLYGLSEARRHLKDAPLVLVEGFNDVLALHSAGFKNVAGMMRALPSPDQWRTLADLNIKNVVLCSDGDDAGQKATEKLIGEVPQGFKVKVAFLPEVDPDEFVVKNGIEEFRAIIAAAVSPIEWLVNDLATRYINGTLEDKCEAIREFIAKSRNLDSVSRTTAVLELGAIAGLRREDALEVMAEKLDTFGVLPNERALLQAVMSDVEVLNTVGVGDEDFLSTIHRLVWRAYKALYVGGQREFDIEGIESQMKQLGGTDRATSQVREICVADASALANVAFHVDKVIDAARRRRLVDSSRVLAVEASNGKRDVADVVKEHLAFVSEDVSRKDIEVVDAGPQVDSAMDYVHERMSNPGVIPGIDLGPKWKTLMHTILGFDKGRYSILAAGPKNGKTATAQNWSMLCAVGQKIPVLWINEEMSNRDLVLRNLSILSGVSNTRLRLGQIESHEKNLVDRAAKAYYESPFYVLQGSGIPLTEIVSTVRKYVHKHGVRLVVLDYLQLCVLDKSGKMEWWQQNYKISQIIRSDIANALDIPVIAISQLERQAVKDGQTGGSYGAGGAKYSHDCDAWLGIRAKTTDEMGEGFGNVVLNVDYNRHGPQQVFVDCDFNRDNLRIQEVRAQ